MTSLEEQEELFTLIGNTLKNKLECFLIGGSAMLYYGAKQITKDIDMVFLNEEDRRVFVEVLKKIGFKKRDSRLVYIKKKNVPLMFQRYEDRFDLFCKEVINIELTDSIIKRVKAVYEYNNLIIKVVSPEDIILLKCATERAGDRLDAAELIKKFNINWSFIIEESVNQTKKDKSIFPVFLYDFLLELREDLKAEIPDEVIKKIRKIGEEEMLKRIRKK